MSRLLTILPNEIVQLRRVHEEGTFLLCKICEFAGDYRIVEICAIKLNGEEFDFRNHDDRIRAIKLFVDSGEKVLDSLDLTECDIRPWGWSPSSGKNDFRIEKKFGSSVNIDISVVEVYDAIEGLELEFNITLFRR